MRHDRALRFATSAFAAATAPVFAAAGVPTNTVSAVYSQATCHTCGSTPGLK